MPLQGRTVLVTRPREQAGALSEALRRLGATVIEAPAIRIDEPLDWSPVDAAIRRLDEYDRIIFTSANAVDRFIDRMQDGARQAASLNPLRPAAIGSSTAARLAARGATPALVAADSHAEGLLDLVESAGSVRGRRILLPRAEQARELLPEELRARGAKVDVVVVYRTVPVPPEPAVLALLAAGRVDVVTFTSASAVHSLIDAAGGAALLARSRIAVLGPVTARAARSRGLEPSIVAPGASVEALAEAIAECAGPSR